jgi:hypothetical protein
LWVQKLGGVRGAQEFGMKLALLFQQHVHQDVQVLCKVKSTELEVGTQQV